MVGFMRRPSCTEEKMIKSKEEALEDELGIGDSLISCLHDICT